MRRSPSTDDREAHDSRSAIVRWCATLADSPAFNIAIFAVILANAVVLGLETYDGVVREAGDVLDALNDIFLGGLRRRAGDPADRLRLQAAELLSQRLERLRLPRRGRVVHAGAARERHCCCGSRGWHACCGSCACCPTCACSTIAIGRIHPGRHEPRRCWRCSSSVHLRDGRLDDLRRARPAQYGTIGEAMLTLFVTLTLENLPDQIAARPRAVGLDDHLLRLLRAGRRVSDLQHPDRRRHQLARGGARDRARARARRRASSRATPTEPRARGAHRRAARRAGRARGEPAARAR